jgi:pyruvate-ferredoxin/flavodoxin oxidoreductase
LIIAYSPCIAHGYDLRPGLEQQKKAVLSGHWPLFHYDPRLAGAGGQAFQFDSKAPSVPLEDRLEEEVDFIPANGAVPVPNVSMLNDGVSWCTST